MIKSRVVWGFLLGPWLVWLTVRAVGIPEGGVLGPVMAFTPYAPLGALTVAVVAAYRRRVVPAVIAVASACGLVAFLIPRMVADSEVGPEGTIIRVVTVNLRIGAVAPQALTDLVRRERVDLLLVQELTPDAAHGLEAASLTDVLPYSERVEAAGDASGSGIYSRYELRGRPRVAGSFGQARAEVAVPGAAPVEVVSAHPCPPMRPDKTDCWIRAFDALQQLDGQQVRILAGDFNATLDHMRLRRLIARGYTDAGDATGNSLAATW